MTRFDQQYFCERKLTERDISTLRRLGDAEITCIKMAIPTRTAHGHLAFYFVVQVQRCLSATRGKTSTMESSVQGGPSTRPTSLARAEHWPRARSATPRDSRIFAAFAIVFGLTSLVFLIWMIEHWGGSVVAGRVDEIGEGVAALIGGVMCLFAAWRSDGRLRISWCFIGAGALAWAAGEAVWCWYDIAKGVAVPFPSQADIGFLAEVPLLIIGVLVFPAATGNVLSRARVMLDGLIVGGSLLAVSWGTVLGATYHVAGQHRFAEVIGLAYPLSDVAVATIAFSTLVRTGRRYRATVGLIIAGLVGLSVSDSAFVYLTQTTTYSSGVSVDVGWVAGFLLLGLAPLWPLPAVKSVPEERRSLSTWQVVLPYAFLVTAGFFIVAKYFLDRHLDAFLATDAIVLVCIVLIRQVLTLLEDAHLTRSLERQTKMDPLTGIGNRLPFAERVNALVDRQRTTGPRVAVLLCDLDDFKDVNDTLGHSVGDALLVAVAKRLTNSVRPRDLVVRLGGDEFGVVIQLDGGPDQPTTVAIRILDAMNVPVAINGHECFPRMSIGIAIESPNDSTNEDLLRNADIALYATKAAGGNSYRVFEPQMGTDHFERLEFQSELAAALERNQLVVEYEPVVSISTGEPVGVEALVRWHHPTLGVLSPDTFLSLAENSGAIVPIGQWVLEQTLMQLHAWRDQLPEAHDLWVAVNFSARQLTSDNFITDVAHALSASEIDADRLRAELTESALIDQDGGSIQSLDSLKSMGVHLTIDDFGTGYSSISYLKWLPIDTLKIDRLFTANVSYNSRDSRIVEAVVNLAHSLDIEVVAEGIETPEQLTHMHQLNCDLGQGYLWSHSKSGDDLARWLEARYRATAEDRSSLPDLP